MLNNTNLGNPTGDWEGHGRHPNPMYTVLRGTYGWGGSTASVQSKWLQIQQTFYSVINTSCK